MTKGTRRRALAALAVGGALSLSCSTATVGVSQEPARGGQVPGWARTRMDPEYPQERYLLGLGMAVLGATPTEALDQATAQSRADIAKQIRSRVTQILRDSVREEDLRGQMSYQRISAVATQETTELDLEGVEVVRQWIGSHSVYVLSVLDRESAAARAEERIARMEERLQGDFREIEVLVNADPLEALAALGRANARTDALVMQYEILSGVTRSLRMPPQWLERIDELGALAHEHVRSTIVIRETEDGEPGEVRTTYPSIESFLVELGWNVRRVEATGGLRDAAVDVLMRRLGNEGIRYLVLIDAEGKTTETVRVGSGVINYARAGGTLELIDLADGEVLHRSSYPFPSE
jgi:hypothetical protein